MYVTSLLASCSMHWQYLGRSLFRSLYLSWMSKARSSWLLLLHPRQACKRSTEYRASTLRYYKQQWTETVFPHMSLPLQKSSIGMSPLLSADFYRLAAFAKPICTFEFPKCFPSEAWEAWKWKYKSPMCHNAVYVLQVKFERAITTRSNLHLIIQLNCLHYNKSTCASCLFYRPFLSNCSAAWMSQEHKVRKKEILSMQTYLRQHRRPA